MSNGVENAEQSSNKPRSVSMKAFVVPILLTDAVLLVTLALLNFIFFGSATPALERSMLLGEGMLILMSLIPTFWVFTLRVDRQASVPFVVKMSIKVRSQKAMRFAAVLGSITGIAWVIQLL